MGHGLDHGREELRQVAIAVGCSGVINWCSGFPTAVRALIGHLAATFRIEGSPRFRTFRDPAWGVRTRRSFTVTTVRLNDQGWCTIGRSNHRRKVALERIELVRCDISARIAA